MWGFFVFCFVFCFFGGGLLLGNTCGDLESEEELGFQETGLLGHV